VFEERLEVRQECEEAVRYIKVSVHAEKRGCRVNLSAEM
jgi:hypothetical protein